MAGRIDPSAIYTLRQASDLSDFSIKTLQRAIKAGELRAAKPRSRRRILGADLIAWLTGRPPRQESE